MLMLMLNGGVCSRSAMGSINGVAAVNVAQQSPMRGAHEGGHGHGRGRGVAKDASGGDRRRVAIDISGDDSGDGAGAHLAAVIVRRG